jgi:hypothetical protein
VTEFFYVEEKPPEAQMATDAYPHQRNFGELTRLPLSQAR